MAKENATIAEAFEDPFKKKIFLTTPTGVAVYPHLISHDKYQLEENNVYQCNTQLRLDADDEFVAQLDEMANEAFEISKVNLQESIDSGKLKGKKLKSAKEALKNLKVYSPYEEGVDEEGEADGTVLLKMKTQVRGVSKKDNKPWKKEIPIFDAKGSAVKGAARSSMKLWGGSLIKVSVQVVPYCAEGLGTAGVSLRISAVQVIELSGGDASAENYGFGEEEGYTADNFDNAEEETEEDDIDDSDDDDEEEDF